MPGARRDGVERLGKLRVVLIEQTGIAPKTLPLEHVASAIGQHGFAQCPRFQRHHGEALVVGGHDQHLGSGHGVELVLVGQEPEVVDAGMFGNRQDRRADEHQAQRSWHAARKAPEEVEQLAATLVLVDATDVDRKRTRDAMLLPEPIGVGLLGHVRADANDHAGKRRRRRHAAASPALRAS